MEPVGKSEPKKEVCDLALELIEATLMLKQCNDEINHTKEVLKQVKKPNAKVDIEDAKKIAEKRLKIAQAEVDRIKNRIDLFRGDFSGEVQAVFDEMDREPGIAAKKLLDLLGRR